MESFRVESIIDSISGEAEITGRGGFSTSVILREDAVGRGGVGSVFSSGCFVTFCQASLRASSS